MGMPLMLILASITSRVVPAISVTIALSLCMLQETMLNKLSNHKVKYARMISTMDSYTQTHKTSTSYSPKVIMDFRSQLTI